jgi:hypothetical protein
MKTLKKKSYCTQAATKNTGVVEGGERTDHVREWIASRRYGE